MASGVTFHALRWARDRYEDVREPKGDQKTAEISLNPSAEAGRWEVETRELACLAARRCLRCEGWLLLAL